jgi:Pyridoxamine 5'-phosphate oxidase
MSQTEPRETTNLDHRYGSATIPWSRASDALASGSPSPAVTFFLGTVGPDGAPHAAGVGGLWQDGSLYFTSNATMRKARDLAGNPACTFSVRLADIDLVLEGEATRVTDTATLEQLAGRFREGGWPAQVEGDAFTAPFSAPSAGPPPWQVYRFVPRVVSGVATAEPCGATRWTF